MGSIFKRITTICLAFLLLVTTLVIGLITYDYDFFVYNEIVWFVLNVSIEAALAALCVKKRFYLTKGANLASQLLPLVSLVYVFAIGFFIQGVNDYLVILHGIICFAACFIVSLLCHNKRGVKITCAVINSILLLLLLWVFFLFIIIGQTVQSGESTIAKEVLSPNESYTAILIKTDEGIWGRSARIDIEYNTSEINIGLGRLKRRTRIYTREWREYERRTDAEEWAAFDTIDLKWKDDDQLIIHGKPYNIDQLLSKPLTMD